MKMLCAPDDGVKKVSRLLQPDLFCSENGGRLNFINRKTDRDAIQTVTSKRIYSTPQISR